MHPVEHLLYFSVVLIHLVVPSHPVHFFFNAQHTALTPSGGHHGFEGAVPFLPLPLPLPLSLSPSLPLSLALSLSPNWWSNWLR